jgi:hypothetical protein
MDDNNVNGRVGRFAVRRVFLPARATESFTLIGPDLRPVELVDEYLRFKGSGSPSTAKPERSHDAL